MRQLAALQAPTQAPTIEERVTALETALARSAAEAPSGLSLVAYRGDLDGVLAALTLATGAAASGHPVSIFFTFWGTAALRRRRGGRGLIARLLGWLLPLGTAGLRLSTLNLGGLGTALMKHRMKQKGIAGCDELLAMARELGVRILVCEMSMDLLGMSLEDLIDYPGLSTCGVATFMEQAARSQVTMFV